jgi:hypothetical protein
MPLIRSEGDFVGNESTNGVTKTSLAEELSWKIDDSFQPDK